MCLSQLKLQLMLQKHLCQLNDETAVASCSLSIFLTCLSPVQNVHMLYKAAAEPGFTQQPAFVWYVVCAKSSWENSQHLTLVLLLKAAKFTPLRKEFPIGVHTAHF